MKMRTSFTVILPYLWSRNPERILAQSGHQKAKAPGHGPGPSCFEVRRRSEPVVHAGANLVGVEADAGRRRAERAVRVAEVDVQILELAGPVAGQCGFDASAGCPACVGVAGGRDEVLRGFDVAHGQAAGSVEHRAIPGVADAAPGRAKPGVLGLAAGRARGVEEAALDVGPVEIAFQAEHPRAAKRLPVVADRSTDHS